MSDSDKESAQTPATASTSGYYGAARAYRGASPSRSKTHVPTPYAVQWSSHWSHSNVKLAKYNSYCHACNLPIRIGHRIVFHWAMRCFVHEECRSLTPPETQPFEPPAGTAGGPIPAVADILGPGSPLEALSPSYRQEAVRWVQFHAECEAIPGIHVPFNTCGLQRYLSHRARTTKCLPFIKCALKKMGMLCNHELHTTQYQQPSLQYQQIQHHCNEL